MKDDQLSTCNQESRLQQPGERQNQKSSVPFTFVSQPWGKSQTPSVDIVGGRQNNSPPLEPWAKGSSPQTSQETELHVSKCKMETSVTSQSCSIIKQNTVEEGDQLINKGDSNQSEKPKHCKKRRQRRKGAGQRVVGLPSSPSASPPILLWFRRDLRLCDNPALTGSLEFGAPVIPIFVWSPEEEEGPGITVAMGGACK